jgi:hypothetical protein
MMFLIHTLQSIEREVRVDLRGRNIGVAQNGLNRAQVCAVLDHVCGTTMAQHVRTGIASHARRCRSNHLPDPLTSQFASSTSEE